MKEKSILFTLLFSIFVFSLPLFAGAQTGIEVSPYRIEETVEPGDTVVRTIRVRNTTDRERTFYADLMDFVVMGEGGNARLMRAGSHERASLTDWITIRRTGTDFDPGERKEVQVTFNVPEDIGPGGYYGAIVFGPSPPDANDQATFVGLTHQVGVLVLFNVMGDADVEARVREFSTRNQVYDTPLQVDFLTRVENIGNLHIKPTGSIQIENMRGDKVASVPLNPDGDNVLPRSIRRIENFWQDDFGFGRYKASLIMNFGEPTERGGTGVRTVSAETNFWVLPRALIGQVAVGILLIILILYVIFRNYKRKAIEEATGKAAEAKSSSGFGVIVAVFLLSLSGVGIYVYFFLL